MTLDSSRLPNSLAPCVDCRCEGDPRQMGQIQGSQLRSKIRGAYGSLRHLEAFRLEQPSWLPYPLFLRLAERKCERSFTPALRQSNPAMLARMEGIASGAGLNLRSLCLMNAMEAVLGSVDQKIILPPLGACSAVAIRGKLARNGAPIIAKNFDYLPVLQPFYILRESRPRGGFRSLDFAVAPQPGTVDGVNEKGLAITLNYAFVTDRGSPGPLITMLIADALASCSTVPEAVSHLTGTPHWGAGILMLAGASGDLACVELSNTRSAVRRPDKGLDWLVCTNLCRCSETQGAQVSSLAAYSHKAPRPLHGCPVLQPHADRAARLESLVRHHNAVAPDELAALMADHGPNGSADGSSPCVHTPYFNTTAALQWFPATRSVRVSYSTACAAKYTELFL